MKKKKKKNKNKEFVKYEYKIKCIGIHLNNKIKYFKTGKECANFLNLNCNLKTNSSSVTHSCRNFKDFYGYKPRYYYLTEKEFNKI